MTGWRDDGIEVWCSLDRESWLTYSKSQGFIYGHKVHAPKNLSIKSKKYIKWLESHISQIAPTPDQLKEIQKIEREWSNQNV